MLNREAGTTTIHPPQVSLSSSTLIPHSSASVSYTHLIALSNVEHRSQTRTSAGDHEGDGPGLFDVDARKIGRFLTAADRYDVSTEACVLQYYANDDINYGCYYDHGGDAENVSAADPLDEVVADLDLSLIHILTSSRPPPASSPAAKTRVLHMRSSRP